MSSATPPGTPNLGMTRRNRPLFLERGHAYIYLAYGSSYMLIVSSEMPGIGAGVLIRALEPLEGIPIMRLNRGIERLRDLARGPGRLTAALRVDRWLDGFDLCRKRIGAELRIRCRADLALGF
jgi:DNA-3-methyladenine glycosylase